jgi:glycosyltransferase involved in cell wall biosynthesis
MDNLVSIIIPDRNGQPYLQQTVDDLLAKAEGDIEIIVVSDGTWPNPPLKNHPKVSLLHHGTHFDNLGMRAGINRGVALSKGQYIMKIDEHCMVDKGFDTKLKADCDDNWVVIPRRYRLMADSEPWRIEEYKFDDNGLLVPDEEFKHIRPPVDYMYLAYPYERPFDKTCGLHGDEWRQRHYDRLDIPIDETMSWQGSCWFTTRKHWDTTIIELDVSKYGTFTQEAQEIGNKTWLSGGKLMVNKKTWYAHMHKGKRGKGYGFSNEQYKRHMEGTERGRLFCIDYWVNNKHLLEHPDWQTFDWLLDKFAPVPTWPENWRMQMEIDKAKDYSNLSEKPDWYQNNQE